MLLHASPKKRINLEDHPRSVLEHVKVQVSAQMSMLGCFFLSLFGHKVYMSTLPGWCSWACDGSDGSLFFTWPRSLTICSPRHNFVVFRLSQLAAVVLLPMLVGNGGPGHRGIGVATTVSLLVTSSLWPASFLYSTSEGTVHRPRIYDAVSPVTHSTCD